jgi:hypothetical protein
MRGTVTANASAEIVSTTADGAGQVVVGANVSQLSLVENERETVSIGVIASSGARGTYGVFPAQFCIGMPLAVGYSVPELNASSFLSLFGSRFCRIELLPDQITGYDGMNATIMTPAMKN